MSDIPKCLAHLNTDDIDLVEQLFAGEVITAMGLDDDSVEGENWRDDFLNYLHKIDWSISQ